MPDETGRRPGPKSTREPLFAATGGGAFLGMSVSLDERYILYPEFDDYQSDIMLVENFQ